MGGVSLCRSVSVGASLLELLCRSRQLRCDQRGSQRASQGRLAKQLAEREDRRAIRAGINGMSQQSKFISLVLHYCLKRPTAVLQREHHCCKIVSIVLFINIFEKSYLNLSLPCQETFRPKTFLKQFVLNGF